MVRIPTFLKRKEFLCTFLVRGAWVLSIAVSKRSVFLWSKDTFADGIKKVVADLGERGRGGGGGGGWGGWGGGILLLCRDNEDVAGW